MKLFTNICYQLTKPIAFSSTVVAQQQNNSIIFLLKKGLVTAKQNNKPFRFQVVLKKSNTGRF